MLITGHKIVVYDIVYIVQATITNIVFMMFLTSLVFSSIMRTVVAVHLDTHSSC